MIEREGILEILPHRPPMLMVDRVVELEVGRRAVAVRTVTEADCEGHFPGHPVLPGVHVVEALAQTAAISFLADPASKGRVVYLVGLDKMRFRRPVRPGDELRLEAQLEGERRGLLTFSVRATVDGQRTVDGTLMATAPDLAATEPA